MAKNIKYPHGFLPKISYWMSKWEEAAEVVDERSMKIAETKLLYFMSRHLEVNRRKYGPYWIFEDDSDESRIVR
jgi:hypothetical protein